MLKKNHYRRDRGTHREGTRRLLTDRPLAESVDQLTHRLKAKPEPAWRYEDCEHVGRIGYRPWEPLLEIIDDAIDQGERQGTPITDEDALSIPNAITAYVYHRLRMRVPSLGEAIRVETKAQGDADVSEVSLALDGSTVNMERALPKLLLHEQALRTLTCACSADLYQSRELRSIARTRLGLKPRGVA